MSKLRLAVVAFLTAAFLVAAGAPASAEPAADAAAKGQRIEMKRVGVDHEVAKAGGYQVRTDSKGVEYVVGTPIGIDGTVEGQCGWSAVDWVAVDYWNHRAKFWTDFEIRPGWPGAMTVDWNVHVIDDYGVSDKPKSALFPNPRQVWGYEHWFTASGPTDILAQVTWGITVLANGTICFSLQPFDWTTVG